MNTKYMVVVAAMAVMLIGATAFATDSAFADKKRHDDKKKGGYEKSQATSQVNKCGNGKLPYNVFCSNTASQIKGDYNSAALASGQGPEEHHSNSNGDMVNSEQASEESELDGMVNSEQASDESELDGMVNSEQASEESDIAGS
jgi:hypothetical protein